MEKKQEVWPFLFDGEDGTYLSGDNFKEDLEALFRVFGVCVFVYDLSEESDNTGFAVSKRLLNDKEVFNLANGSDESGYERIG